MSKPNFTDPDRSQLILDMLDNGVMVAQTFDRALIGAATRNGVTVAVYSVALILEILAEDGMPLDCVQEYFDFNIEGAWLGEGTPIFLHTPESDLIGATAQ